MTTDQSFWPVTEKKAGFISYKCNKNKINSLIPTQFGKKLSFK